ncbi:MAG: hypothetical protein Q9171_006772, partial [Xanthocarpia ochracea]
MLLKWSIPLLAIVSSLVQALAAVKPRAPPILLEDLQEEDEVCTIYKACVEKGYRYWNELHTTLSNYTSIDRSDGLELFERYYRPEVFETMKLEDEPDLEQAFVDRNLDTRNMGCLGRVIVAMGNWRNNDRNRKENQLQWSEIVYQTWKLAANMPVTEGEDHSPGGPISNLRAVVQSLVTNAGTLAILKIAYEANDWVPHRDGEWRQWTEPGTCNFFYALLGTDNVKGTVWLLKDHAVEIGRKDISSIWTMWNGNADIWYGT